MAKKRKHGEKSRAVREYLHDHPNAAPNDIVAALKTNGLSVSKQMISTVKLRMGARPKKRGRKKGTAAGKNGGMLAIDTLLQAKRLADQLGGIAKARQAIDALAKLQ